MHISVKQHLENGVSLIEVIIFIVIISVGIVGILPAFNQMTRSSVDPMLQKQAISLAEALLEEISRAAFTWCDPLDANFDSATSTANCASYPEGIGPEAGNLRPYDNVNDYDGLTLSGFRDQSGNLIAGLEGYSLVVTTTPAALNGIPAADALRVLVQVTAPNQQVYLLEGWRTRHSPNAPP
jgi:MSHA pilin protein MshD